MKNKIKNLRIWLYILLFADALICAFTSVLFTIDLKIYYFAVGPINEPIDFDFPIPRIILIGMILIEAALAADNRKGASTIGILLCVVRILPMLLIGFCVFNEIVGRGDLLVYISFCAYISPILGAASFVLHVLIRKQKVKEFLLTNELSEEQKNTSEVQ